LRAGSRGASADPAVSVVDMPNAAATERLHCPSSGFTSSLYEFVSNCQELSLVPLKELTNSALRRALETILTLFDDNSFSLLGSIRLVLLRVPIKMATFIGLPLLAMFFDNAINSCFTNLSSN
jgi:hypothetical protein